MTQSQVHHGRISAEEAQLPRQSAQAKAALSSARLSLSSCLTTLLDVAADLAPFPGVAFVLRKQRFPCAPAARLMLINIHILERYIYLFL